MFIHQALIRRQEFDVVEFDSITEYYKYLCDTPINETFRWRDLHSVSQTEEFTQTKSFDEATELLKNGWEDMANKLTQKLKAIDSEIQVNTKQKTIYDVGGFQASVPRYLQGIPTNMINKKNFPSTQKVITVNKSCCYSGGVKTEQIVEESVKALQIVKKLEAQGLRVNLNLIFGQRESDFSYITKVRIKSANERLNVSKLAFPLVHPSMLRRLQFRMTEVYPKVTKSFVFGYGSPMAMIELKECTKGEYLIPAFVKNDVNSLKDLSDLQTDRF